MSEIIESFFKKWGKRSASFKKRLPITDSLELSRETGIPQYDLLLDNFDTKKIFDEARSNIHRFVEHRPGEGHRGWKGITLHGLGSEKTMCSFDYGIDENDAKYDWTEVASSFPETTRFFKQNFPATRYKRIRIMLVEPGGYILPHRDREHHALGPLSIPINVPTACEFALENFGLLKLKPGMGSLIDISNRHSVWNRSSEPRFHVIAECLYGENYQKFIDMVYQSYPIRNNRLYFFDKRYYEVGKKLKVRK